MNRKQATKLRNDAIMSLINSGSTSIWSAQIVALNLEDVRYHNGKTQVWLVRRNGSKRFETLGCRAGNILESYMEQGRRVLEPAPGEVTLFINRFGRRLSTRSIRNIVNEFANEQRLRIAPPEHGSVEYPQAIIREDLSALLRKVFNQLSQGPIVYFVRRLRDGAVKVGWSFNFMQRWGSLTNEHGAVDLLGIMPGDKYLEGKVKADLAEYAIEGSEIFLPTTEVFDYIESLLETARY